MRNFLPAAGYALTLGIWTSITPCALASNVAAIAYIARRLDRRRQVILVGLAYALGYLLAYAGLGMLTVGGLLAGDRLATLLHTYVNPLAGPLLVLLGMVFLELLRIPMPRPTLATFAQRQAETLSAGGAVLLGMLLALSFCPVSGAIFFFTLIPCAVRAHSPIALPSLYALGATLPVIVFAWLLAFRAQALARTFHQVTRLERGARFLAGLFLLGLGMYQTVVYVFE